MKIDYGVMIGPSPIKLSIGSIKKPTLKEIEDITFDTFGMYQDLLRLTPEIFYGESKDEERVAYWESLTDEEKVHMRLYDIVLKFPQLQMMYLNIFNFFFVEDVVFLEDCFVILNPGADRENLQIETDIRGVVNENKFQDVINVMAQVCGMDVEEEEREEDQHFKNEIARKIWLKMQAGRLKKKKNKKADKNLTLPNIISSLAGGRHSSLNYLNVYDLTLYQAIDTFNRLQLDAFYDIDATRVSVWGDEKKTFDSSLWYKNEFDK